MRKGSSKMIRTTAGRKKLNVNGGLNPVTKEVIAIVQEKKC